MSDLNYTSEDLLETFYLNCDYLLTVPPGDKRVEEVRRLHRERLQAEKSNENV